MLIDVLQHLLPRWPLLKVLLVGGGPQEAALQERARKANLCNMVVFAGRVPHEQVQRYYDLIDVLVYPRRSMRLTELVTPLKPLVAMAQGRVLAASIVGGHRELIRDGETGYLFLAGVVSSLAATLHRALRARPVWDRMRLAARGYVEQERNWARVASRYADLYLPLVARGSLPAVSSL
jgi:glycosyltransferase involved in cell wall biosynthesis